jgi:hypothetical protein
VKHLCAIIQVIAFSAIQIIGSNSLGISNGGFLDGKSVIGSSKSSVPSLSSIIGYRLIVGGDEGESPYGLYYDPDRNTWTLFATVLQIKKTSIYGFPGEIAQIAYSIDGETLRNGWIAVRINDYSFLEGDGRSTSINLGQDIRLYISGEYVSVNGVDWEKCPKGDIYCMHASFVEGGFPKSDDYFGLPLCPSNTIIHSGSIPDDWINGGLAWRVEV